MMNRFLVPSLTMLAGIAIGAVAVQAPHAQGKAKVYYIAEINVTNSDAYGKEYAPKARALIESHGGRYLAIGGSGGAAAKITSLEGDAPQRAVIQVWDSMEQLQAWRNDPQFKELRKIGDQYAKFRAYAIEEMAR